MADPTPSPPTPRGPTPGPDGPLIAPPRRRRKLSPAAILLFACGAVILAVVIPCGLIGALVISGGRDAPGGGVGDPAVERDLLAVYQGLAFYARSNEGRLPDPDGDWMRSLLDARKVEPRVFEHRGLPFGAHRFLLVPQESWNPGSARPLIIEHPDATPGGGHVCHANRTVRFVAEPEFTHLLRSVTRPDGTHWDPPGLSPE